mgnify:CR=1 FL=1
MKEIYAIEPGLPKFIQVELSTRYPRSLCEVRNSPALLTPKLAEAAANTLVDVLGLGHYSLSVA